MFGLVKEVCVFGFVKGTCPIILQISPTLRFAAPRGFLMAMLISTVQEAGQPLPDTPWATVAAAAAEEAAVQNKPAPEAGM